MCKFQKVPSWTVECNIMSACLKSVFSRQALCFAVFWLSSWADPVIAFPASPLSPAYRKAHWGWLLCCVAKVYAQAKTAGHNAPGGKSTLDPRECDGGVYMSICLRLRLALIPTYTGPWVWIQSDIALPWEWYIKIILLNVFIHEL